MDKLPEDLKKALHDEGCTAGKEAAMEIAARYNLGELLPRQRREALHQILEGVILGVDEAETYFDE